MKKRKFHIRCDMEGVAGVVGMPQVTPGDPEYPQAREWFMRELLALVEGLLEGGADDVSIFDEHWFGRNIDIARLPRGVRACCGKPPYRPDWAGGLDASCDGLILHGLHSMEGAGHLLSHTYEPDFKAIYINGKLVGEIGMETAVAGDFGVPLVLVVADSAGTAEARALVPGVVTVDTKISRSPLGAECLALPDVLDRIHSAAVAVARGPSPASPWKLNPAELVCVFKPGAYLDELRRQAPALFVAGDSLRINAPTATAAWAEYWQAKLKAQAKL
ncbi:MAG: M55 family metallopeptidase [Opitutaceae bacterium]|jgi:D-amino peptidase|nr:M55 family metallopeptidase [Opitutaceae bacterium]